MNDAKIVCHSVSPEDVELLSFVITFPRVCLAEVVTHRMVSDTWGEHSFSFHERTKTKDISKNSASSRAIPIEKMIGKILDQPFMPPWTLQQKGMQGGMLNDAAKAALADAIWLEARNNAIASAKELNEIGIHKQDANRLLEPWQHVTQIVTASRWDNFFALRCHEKAYPPFRDLARRMYLLKRKSIPDRLAYGQWHLPFVDKTVAHSLYWLPQAVNPLEAKWIIPAEIQLSAARCAWISYENAEKDASVAAVERTWNALMAAPPIHASPVEHQATPLSEEDALATPALRSNLHGWLQGRKLIKNEVCLKYEPSEEEVASWGITV